MEPPVCDACGKVTGNPRRIPGGRQLCGDCYKRRVWRIFTSLFLATVIMLAVAIACALYVNKQYIWTLAVLAIVVVMITPIVLGAGARGGRFRRSVDSKTCQAAVDRGADMAAVGCWHAALWWAAEALQSNRNSKAARELFMRSLAPASVGMVTIFASVRGRVDSATKLLRRRHMSSQEAANVAETLISSAYLESVIQEHKPLLDRFNDGRLHAGAKVSNADLESAREIALDLGDETLPGQTKPVQWATTEGDRVLEESRAAYASQVECLAILLQTDSAAEWPRTCHRLNKLLSRFPWGEEAAGQFHQMSDEWPTEPEFRRYRDGFEGTFAKNAAYFKKLCCRLRRPI